MTDRPPPLPNAVAEAPAADRVGWIDIFRGIAILLVVFGHTARGLDNAKLMAYAGSFLDRWVYAFHMPAFFFAAGLFAAHSLARGGSRFVGDKLRTVVWPYFLWSVLFLLSQKFAGNMATTAYNPNSWWRLGFVPVGNYWFLHALFFIQMLYLVAAIPPWGRTLFWWLAIALWAIEPYKPLGGVLGPTAAGTFHHVLKYAVYFAFGDWVAWRTADGGTAPRDTGVFAVISFAMMTLLVALGRTHEHGWWALPLALAGIQGLWELSVALDRSGAHPWLTFFGQRSLEIYLVHNFVGAATRSVLVKFGVTSGMLHLVIGTVASVAVPLVVWWICQAVKFPYLFQLKKKAVKQGG